jgi:glycerol-3-phosphate dehydrogenase (NAD+)
MRRIATALVAIAVWSAAAYRSEALVQMKAPTITTSLHDRHNHINRQTLNLLSIEPNRRRAQSQSALSMIGSSSPPPYPVRIAVVGGGNFGLALATVAARNGIPTTLLVRSTEDAHIINTQHYHPRKMSDFVLPPKLRATANPAECLPDATYIIHAVPVQYSRAFLNEIAPYIPPNTPVLSGSKGIETTSLGFMADILRECLGEERSYAFLSGPSFAREICEEVATAVVIASEDLLLARDLAALLSDASFRIFTSKDVVGIEVGGAVKNVIALAAGMCEGLGLGTNAMSGLVTRGCGEMRRLGVYFGARPSTIAGLSGTCMCVCSWRVELDELEPSVVVVPTNRSFIGRGLGANARVEKIHLHQLVRSHFLLYRRG